MAISVTSIGTNSGTTIASVSVTVPVGGVPAGTCIILGVSDNNGTLSIGTVTDSAGNSYRLARARADSGGAANLCLFFAYNALALSSGQTIAYTATGTSTALAISAFYATGTASSYNPLDWTLTADGAGSTSPATTPASAGTFNAGELIVGLIGAVSNGAVGSFVQDSTNHAYTAPPVLVGTNVAGTLTNAVVGGGTFVLTGNETPTYAPTISGFWSSIIACFKPANTIVFLTNTAATSWPVPSNWNNANNNVELIGPGGNGAAGTTTASGGGGAAAEYRMAQNLTLSGSVTIQVPAGGSGLKTIFGTVQAGNGINATGTPGGTGSVAGTGGIISKSGSAGGSGANGSGGGGGSFILGSVATGAAGADGGGTTTDSGGGGGGGTVNIAASKGTAGSSTSGGAGGLGAYRNAGGAGATVAGSNGGAGTNGSGGGGGYSSTASAGAGGAGGFGIEWDSAHGLGGGGGGGSGETVTLITGGNGGSGGLYGSGGGGGGQAVTTPGTAGTGAQGMIVITYSPMLTAVAINWGIPEDSSGTLGAGIQDPSEAASTIAHDLGAAGEFGKIVHAP